MTSSLDHYNRHAEQYAAVNHTLASPLLDVTDFIAQLRTGRSFPTDRPARLLDAGSGTGRDTLFFLNNGFEVDAFDGSPAMAELSSRLTGHPTRVMRFEALDLPADRYDGIWAMASLLHVDRQDLPEVVVNLGRALRPGGLLFASFKLGDRTRVSDHDGRVFTDLDESGLTALMGAVEGFQVVSAHHREPSSGQSYAAPWFSVILERPGPAPTLKVPAPANRRARSRTP